jgi:hypothetical protein
MVSRSHGVVLALRVTNVMPAYDSRGAEGRKEIVTEQRKLADDVADEGQSSPLAQMTDQTMSDVIQARQLPLARIEPSDIISDATDGHVSPTSRGDPATGRSRPASRAG